MGGKGNEWRFYMFAEAGELTLQDTLPEQVSRFDMASYGFGSRVRLRDHFNGSLDAGIPLISTPTTNVHDVRFTFRMWAEF
jgi:hemolysin activation/secretion protein